MLFVGVYELVCSGSCGMIGVSSVLFYFWGGRLGGVGDSDVWMVLIFCFQFSFTG